MNQAPLFGLLLVGGKSSRMGQDKASIVYRDDTQEWKRLHQILVKHCDAVLLCHRGDQDFGVPAVIDPGDGPLLAIHTAQKTYPDVAWLTLACDLPLLEEKDVKLLISNRDGEFPATCYSSSIDKLPEPLCCIYEPHIANAVKKAIDNKTFCPRSVLKTAKLVTLSNPTTLLNANTKADTIEIQHILNNTQMEKTLTLQYFAQLRDITGKESEQINSKSSTASGLYEELRTRYSFPYKQKQLMLAINDDFSPWEQELQPNDNIVFIPPVAGG